MIASQGDSAGNADRLNGPLGQAIQALFEQVAEGKPQGLDKGLVGLPRTRFEVAFYPEPGRPRRRWHRQEEWEERDWKKRPRDDRTSSRRLREWLTIVLPGLTEVHQAEVPPGALINAILASTPTGHLATLEAPLQTFFGEGSLFSHFLQQARRETLGVWTASVPLGATRRGRHFAEWMERSGYRLVFNADHPEKSAVVDRSGATVAAPLEWAHLVGQPLEAIRWGPALVFAAEAPQPVMWVEAAMVRMAGGKILLCPARHRYVWIGRKSKRWCPAHRRAVEALEVRWRRLKKRLREAAPRDRDAMQRSLTDLEASLRGLGYRWRRTATRRRS